MTEYLQLLNEAKAEYESYILERSEKFSTKEFQDGKYCIKCRFRRREPGHKFCTHCNCSLGTETIVNKKQHSVRIVNSISRFCGVPGCNKKHYAKGKCFKHYNTIKKRESKSKLKYRKHKRH